jgi:hypothetical protein
MRTCSLSLSRELATLPKGCITGELSGDPDVIRFVMVWLRACGQELELSLDATSNLNQAAVHLEINASDEATLVGSQK